MPTHLERDVYVSAIGFMAGNKRYVHHSRIMVDTLGQTSSIDGLSEFDSRSLALQTKPLMDEFLYGWVPGNIPVAYLLGTAKLIPKGADLFFNIQYAPSSEVATDLSEVHLYLSDVPAKHLIKAYQFVRRISQTNLLSYVLKLHLHFM